LTPAGHHHGTNSCAGALVKMGLAFGCKDCESVFVVFSAWDLKEIAFFQTVEVEGQVAGRVDACIVEEVVHHTGRTVFDALDVAQVMDGPEHLIGFSRQGTILEQGPKRRTSLGKTGLSGCRHGGFEGLFPRFADAFEKHRPRVFGFQLGDLFVNLNRCSLKVDFDIACLNGKPQSPRPRFFLHSNHS